MNLTPREKEIVDRLADWQSPKSIAAELRIGVKTVYTHILHISQKIPEGSSDPPLRRVVRWSLQARAT